MANIIPIVENKGIFERVKALKEKGILDEEGTGRGNVVFDDPLFAIWLKEC